MKTEYYRKPPCPTLYGIRLYRLLVKLKVLKEEPQSYLLDTWPRFVTRMYHQLYGKQYSWNGEHFEEE